MGARKEKLGFMGFFSDWKKVNSNGDAMGEAGGVVSFIHKTGENSTAKSS